MGVNIVQLLTSNKQLLQNLGKVKGGQKSEGYISEYAGRNKCSLLGLLNKKTIEVDSSMVQNTTTFETSFDKSDINNLINNNNLNYPVVSNSSADPYFHLTKTQSNHLKIKLIIIKGTHKKRDHGPSPSQEPPHPHKLQQSVIFLLEAS